MVNRFWRRVNAQFTSGITLLGKRTVMSKISYFCPYCGIAFLKTAVYNECNFRPLRKAETI